MPAILSYQQPLRQRLPEILGSVDYQNFRETLGRMSELIAMAGLDRIVIDHWIEVAEKQGMNYSSPRVARRIMVRLNGQAAKVQSYGEKAIRGIGSEATTANGNARIRTGNG